jgi:catechol 2,3-dioxygenase-like lactoylglutathione lyase family enzyme
MLKRLESIQNIFFPVRNIAKSKQWYQERLGLEVKKESDVTVDFQVYKGDTLLTLVQTNDFKPIQYLDKEHVTPYYNFNTLDAEKCHLRLQTYDVRVTDILELEMIKFSRYRCEKSYRLVC